MTPSATPVLDAIEERYAKLRERLRDTADSDSIAPRRMLNDIDALISHIRELEGRLALIAAAQERHDANCPPDCKGKAALLELGLMD